jgi:hypothetical protein
MESEALNRESTLPEIPRRRWETPRITLERSLQVVAQQGIVGPSGEGPSGIPGGFLGPLGTSGGVC